MTPSASPDTPTAHEHEWQPNGTVEVEREMCSPVSRWDDALWTDVLAVQSCRCGKVRRVRVGTKNARSRGDDFGMPAR